MFPFDLRIHLIWFISFKLDCFAWQIYHLLSNLKDCVRIFFKILYLVEGSVPAYYISFKRISFVNFHFKPFLMMLMVLATLVL